MESLLGCVKPDEVPELPDASDSGSESSQSDLDDVFDLRERLRDTLPSDYLQSDRMQWLAAVRQVASLLREDVTLPLKPGSCKEVFTDVASARLLPTWHCAFRGCIASSAESSEQENHERGVWRHIWHTREHRSDLTRTARHFSLVEPHLHKNISVLLRTQLHWRRKSETASLCRG